MDYASTIRVFVTLSSWANLLISKWRLPTRRSFLVRFLVAYNAWSMDEQARRWGLLRLGFEMCIIGGHCGIDSLLASNFLTYVLITLVHPLLLSFDHAVMFLYTPFQSPSLAQSSSWNSSLSIPYSQSNKTLLSRSERVPLDCSLAEIQYLAFIHENLVRWHYSMFGTHNGTMPFFQF